MKKLTLKGARIIAGVVISAAIALVALSAMSPKKGATIAISTDYAPIYSGDRNSDCVAISVNVYEGGEIVREMLEVLKAHGAKATFFVGGCWADDNGDVLVEIAAAGFEIGNHGFLHLDEKKLSEEAVQTEIKSCHAVVRAATGVEMNLFAPPSGSFGKNTLTVAEKLGYKTIMWSKDTIDWRDASVEKVYKRATSGVQGGDIILMHPKKHTLAALGDILEYYEKKGLRAVTVSECIGEHDL